MFVSFVFFIFLWFSLTKPWKLTECRIESLPNRENSLLFSSSGLETRHPAFRLLDPMAVFTPPASWEFYWILCCLIWPQNLVVKSGRAPFQHCCFKALGWQPSRLQTIKNYWTRVNVWWNFMWIKCVNQQIAASEKSKNAKEIPGLIINFEVLWATEATVVNVSTFFLLKQKNCIIFWPLLFITQAWIQYSRSNLFSLT